MTRRGEISCEPSLGALLADPLVHDLMAADKVDVGELRLVLDKIANLLTRHGTLRYCAVRATPQARRRSSHTGRARSGSADASVF